MLQDTFDAAVKENQEEFGMEVNVSTKLMQQVQTAVSPVLCLHQALRAVVGAARGSNAECHGGVQAPGELCCACSMC